MESLPHLHCLFETRQSHRDAVRRMPRTRQIPHQNFDGTSSEPFYVAVRSTIYFATVRNEKCLFD